MNPVSIKLLRAIITDVDGAIESKQDVDLYWIVNVVESVLQLEGYGPDEETQGPRSKAAAKQARYRAKRNGGGNADGNAEVTRVTGDGNRQGNATVTRQVTRAVTRGNTGGGVGGEGLDLGSQSLSNKSKLLGSEKPGDPDLDPARAQVTREAQRGNADGNASGNATGNGHGNEPASGVRVTILEKAKQKPIHDEQHRASALRQQQELAEKFERGELG